MSDYVEITWHIEDGYCGDRPQYTEISLDEFSIDMDDFDIVHILEEAMNDDWEARSFAPELDNEEDVVEQVREMLREKEEE